MGEVFAPLAHGRKSRPVQLAAALFLPAIVAAFFPQALYDNFAKFLAWTVLVFSPVAGVTLVDFLLLRRRRLDHRGLYDETDSGVYRFWRGWNIAALASIAFGGLIYFLLLNPQTLAYHGPFEFVSASGPACVAAAAMYVVLTKLLVQPRGKGGYTVPVRGLHTMAVEDDSPVVAGSQRRDSRTKGKSRPAATTSRQWPYETERRSRAS
jgi:purine-cytosine permease-like protein